MNIPTKEELDSLNYIEGFTIGSYEWDDPDRKDCDVEDDCPWCAGYLAGRQYARNFGS